MHTMANQDQTKGKQEPEREGEFAVAMRLTGPIGGVGGIGEIGDRLDFIKCKIKCGWNCRDCFPLIGCVDYFCCELSDCTIEI